MLLSLPRKTVVRLTDRPDMTAVSRGRKTTIQQQQQVILGSKTGATKLLFAMLKKNFDDYIHVVATCKMTPSPLRLI